MRIDSYNSFFISGLMHSLFLAVFFVVLPKPDYKVNAPIDISFLFHAIDNEAQKHQASIQKTVSKSERVAAYPKTIARMENPQTAASPVVEPTIHPSKIESLLSDKPETPAGTNDSHLPAVSSIIESVDTGSGYSGLIPTASMPSGSAGTGIDKSAIIRAFGDKIESMKHYPYIARRRGIEGAVLILVHLDKTGELKDVVLKKSSGYEILDISAVELIKKASPFRHGYNLELKIEIPITYKLLR